MKNVTKSLIIILVAIFMLTCSDSSTEPEMDNVSISFGITNSLNKTTADLQIDSAKILVRRLKLNSTENDSLNIMTDPFVVVLDLEGEINGVALADIPAGTYDKIKFEIHKLEATATPPDPDFLEGSDRYSVIVYGLYESNPFVYKSTKSAKQIIHLEEAVNVEDGALTNFTLLVNPSEWFDKNGTTLDPSDSANENDIDKNIKESFLRVSATITRTELKIK